MITLALYTSWRVCEWMYGLYHFIGIVLYAGCSIQSVMKVFVLYLYFCGCM